MSVYGFDEYKNKVLLSDMVPTDVPVPSVLADGSVIYYDRGSNYGQYNLTDGVITRVSDGMDNGSPSSSNWRYLIISNETYHGIYLYNEDQVYTGDTGNYNDTTSMGYGFQATTNMLNFVTLNSNNEDVFLHKIYDKRQSTGLPWSLPCGSELVSLYNLDGGFEQYGINIESDFVWSGTSRYIEQSIYDHASGIYMIYNGHQSNNTTYPNALNVSGQPSSVMIRRI